MREEEWVARYDDETWVWDDPDLGQVCVATYPDPLDRAPVRIIVDPSDDSEVAEAYLSVEAAEKLAAAIKDAAERAWLRAHPAPPPPQDGGS